MTRLSLRLRPVAAALAFALSAAPAPAAPPDSIILGATYNIFHDEYATDEEFFRQVDRDVAAMVAANLDHVMIFPMSEWDPETRELRWVRTDHLVRRIEEAGLKFVPLLFKQEQCSHWFPIWKYRELPGLWERHNLRNGYPNNRENVDFADPRIFPLVEEYFRAVVARYGRSPALDFYNVWNEPHYAGDADHVVERFRAWLARKYGSLAALRRAWGEDYTGWQEVSPFLNDDWNSSLPGIDWTLFQLELNGTLAGELAAVLRRHDTTHAVTVNPVNTPFAGFERPGGYSQDNWQFGAHEDFESVSYYPDGWDREHSPERQPLWRHNLSFNIFRSAARERRYILTEIYTNAKNGLTLGGYLDYATARQIAWAALANDCKGMIYWKWEPFRRGRQSLGRGLTRLDGTLAPRGEAVRDLGAVLKTHGPLLREARLAPPEVGVLIDMVGLLEVLDHSMDARTRTFMYESHAGLFKALDEANLGADVLRTDLGVTAEQLRRYKILFLPFQVVMRREVAALLADYVRQGGWLVADARTATLDELDLAFRVSPGAGLDELFGADRADWTGQRADFAVRLDPALPGAPAEFSGRFFREQLRVHAGAQVIGAFADDGEPAVVLNRVGAGATVLAAVPLGASYHANAENPVNRFILACCAAAGVRAPATFVSASGAQPSIRVHRRGADRVIYVINPLDTPLAGELEFATGAADAAALRATDIVAGKDQPLSASGGRLRTPLALDPYGVAVLHVAPRN